MDDTSTAGANGIPSDPSIVHTPKIEPWTIEIAVAALELSGNSSPEINFIHMLERLKTTKRQGWLRYDIEMVESIADHMYRMAMMCLFSPSPLDSQKCIMMALIHDLSEAIVGDIIPADGIAKDEKSRREREAMYYMTQHLETHHRRRILAIWEEYEGCMTAESKFVHDMDKVELLAQMIEYEKRGKGKLNLSEFVNVAKRVRTPKGLALTKDLLAERAEFWKGKNLVNHEAGVKEELQDQYYGAPP